MCATLDVSILTTVIMDFLTGFSPADLIETSLLATLLLERVLEYVNPVLKNRIGDTVAGTVLKAISDGRLDKDEVKGIAEKLGN